MEKPKFEGFGMVQNEFPEFGDNYQESNDVPTVYISSSLILKTYCCAKLWYGDKKWPLLL